MENNPVNVLFTKKRTSKGGKCHVLETPSERDDMCIYTLRWLAHTNPPKPTKTQLFQTKRSEKLIIIERNATFKRKQKYFKNILTRAQKSCYNTSVPRGERRTATATPAGTRTNGHTWTGDSPGRAHGRAKARQGTWTGGSPARTTQTT